MEDKQYAMRAAIEASIAAAIAAVGIEGLKATSLFLSNERRGKAP